MKQENKSENFEVLADNILQFKRTGVYLPFYNRLILVTYIDNFYLPSNFRPVLKDLSRILILLNKEDCFLNPPSDWEILFAWGDRVLRRFKKQHPIMV